MKPLKRRNDLMNSLSNSLDKQEVLNSIVENICRIMNADRGIIALIDSNNEYASFGLSLAEEKQFIDNLQSGMITRLQETKKAFTIKRNCTPLEKGYHTEELFCYDLYVASGFCKESSSSSDGIYALFKSIYERRNRRIRRIFETNLDIS